MLKRICVAPIVALLPDTAMSVELVDCEFGRVEQGTEEIVYVLHQRSEVFARFDRDCDGQLSPDEAAAYRADELQQAELTLRDIQRRRPGGIPLEVRPPSRSPGAEPEPEYFQVRPILRRDFQDVTILKEPFDPKDAAGAEFSWANDGVRDTETWSAAGLLALPIVFRREMLTFEESFPPYVDAVTFAPYVLFERTANAIENLAFGAAGEMSLANLWRTTHYFRVKGSALTDFDVDEWRSWSVAAEYEPVSNDLYIGTPFPIGTLPATAEIAPLIQAIYSREIGETSLPIYAEEDHAFRVGPSVRVTLAPMQFEAVPDWIMRTRLIASYSYLYDVISERSYSLFKSTLAYNLDETGHVAITGSYQTGRTQESGERIDLFKAGFAAKY